MHLQKIVYIAVLILFTSKGWALVFNSETEVGTNVFVETLGFSGDFDPIQNKYLSAWDVAVSTASTKYIDSVSTQSSTDHTNDLFGSLGWNLNTNIKSQWGLDAGLHLGNNPDQKLSIGGLNVGLSYTHTFSSPTVVKKETDEQGDEIIEEEVSTQFAPWIRVGLELGATSYTQRTDGRRKSGFFTGKYDNKLGQKSVSLSIANKPMDWFSWRVRGSSYTYDEDLTEFLNYLNSNVFLSRLNEGLSSAVSSLSRSDGSLKLTFYPSDFWDFYFLFSNSKSAIDDSVLSSTRSHIDLNLTPEFTAGFGIKKTTTSTIADTAVIIDFDLIF